VYKTSFGLEWELSGWRSDCLSPRFGELERARESFKQGDQ